MRRESPVRFLGGGGAVCIAAIHSANSSNLLAPRAGFLPIGGGSRSNILRYLSTLSAAS